MPWVTHPNVTAIFAAHLPGEESGKSSLDVLWGTFTHLDDFHIQYPVTEADYGFLVVDPSSVDVNSPTAWQSNFTEGLLIDYRYFDALKIEPLYEFGSGLSYTTFEVTSDLSIQPLVANPHPTMAVSSNCTSDKLGGLFVFELDYLSRV